MSAQNERKSAASENSAAPSAPLTSHFQGNSPLALRRAAILSVTTGSLLLLVALPPIRDWLVRCIDADSLKQLTANKALLGDWLDWLKLLLEVCLAVLIGNQLFNEPIRQWFVNRMHTLHRQLTQSVELRIPGKDCPQRIRALFDEATSLAGVRSSLKDIVKDAVSLKDIALEIYRETTVRLPYFFVRLAALKALAAFSGGFHFFGASLIFLGLLLVKVLKAYLTSI